MTYRLLSGVTTPGQALRRLIPPVGFVSAFINTTPIVAMLIPATHELEQHSGVPARRAAAHRPRHHAGRVGNAHRHQFQLADRRPCRATGEGDDVLVRPDRRSGGPRGWGVLLITAPLMLRGRTEVHEPDLSWRAEIPLSAKANAVGGTAAELGIGTTRDFELLDVRRSGKKVGADTVLENADVLMYRATEAGVRMLWASPRFGLSPQALYLVSITTDEEATVRDLEEDEDIQVIAAQTTKRLKKTPATPGELCLVTAASTDALTDHEMVGLWQKVAGKAPQPRKTWIALSILAGVVLVGSWGLEPIQLVAVAGAVPHGDHRCTDTAVGGARPELEHPGNHRRLGRSGDHRRKKRSRRPHLRRNPGSVGREHRTGNTSARGRYHPAEQCHQHRRGGRHSTRSPSRSPQTPV